MLIQNPLLRSAVGSPPSGAAAHCEATSPPSSASAEPIDTLTRSPHLISPGDIKKVAAGGFIKLLDVRVPTTTKPMSAERRDAILNTVQPGDIILETDNSYPGWQRMEMLTLHSVHTHAAIYEGNGNFLEATTPDGVQRTDLKSYLDGRISITLLRPDYKTPQDRDAALDYCRSQLGKPYGEAFDLHDPNSQYCAGLVYHALQAMPNKIDVPVKHVFGKEAVGPDSFLTIGGTRVYDDGASFWKNQISHWPVASVAVGSAIAGAHLGGPLGAASGFLGGLALAICAGNKMQTGHFNLSGS